MPGGIGEWCRENIAWVCTILLALAVCSGVFAEQVSKTNTMEHNYDKAAHVDRFGTVADAISRISNSQIQLASDVAYIKESIKRQEKQLDQLIIKDR
jgi:hypothetical protein